MSKHIMAGMLEMLLLTLVVLLLGSAAIIGMVYSATHFTSPYVRVVGVVAPLVVAAGLIACASYYYANRANR